MNKMEIFTTLEKLLTQDGLRHSSDAKNGAFHFGIQSEGRIEHLLYTIIVEDDLSYSVIVIGEGISADETDKQAMQRMAEFICRANYGLKSGNFNLDFSDGEINFKTFVDCRDTPTITKEVFRNSISVPAHMFKRYGDGIMEMIDGTSTPEDAIRRAEA